MHWGYKKKYIALMLKELTDKPTTKSHVVQAVTQIRTGNCGGTKAVLTTLGSQYFPEEVTSS